jgi:hypothetical protein
MAPSMPRTGACSTPTLARKKKEKQALKRKFSDWLKKLKRNMPFSSRQGCDDPSSGHRKELSEKLRFPGLFCKFLSLKSEI